MPELTDYPNVGDKLASELQRAGIATYDRLVQLGAVEAALRITRGRPHTGYNLLYALEGAIRGIRWHAIAKADRAALKAEYDRRRRESAG